MSEKQQTTTTFDLHWPETPGASAFKVAEDCSTLCLNCGLCCNGSYLSYANVTKQEAIQFSAAGMDINFADSANSSRKKFRATLPCPCHKNGRCSIFPVRPSVCQSYRCNLLKSVTNGKLSGSEAMAITSHLKDQFNWLIGFSKRHGYIDFKNDSLYRVLFDFHYNALARSKCIQLYEHEVEFVKNSFQYLQNIDRTIAEIDVAYYEELLHHIKARQKDDQTRHPTRRVFEFLGDSVVEFVNCNEIIDPLRRSVRGYVGEEIDPVGNELPVGLRIHRTDAGYFWDSPYPGPYMSSDTDRLDKMDVVNDIHHNAGNFGRGINPHRNFKIHCAAIEFGKGLVLLVGVHGAGKSVLSASFADRGHRIFADDEIAIELEHGRGVAIGRTPMLRLPFPKRLVPQGSILADEKLYLNDNGSYTFIDLPQNLLAPLGLAKEIVGTVYLNRDPKINKLQFFEASNSAMLKLLIGRTNMLGVNATAVLDTLLRVVADAKKYVIEYGDFVECGELIEEMFCTEKH